MALGFGHSWLAIWVLPLGFVVGLTFGAFGLVMNSLAPGYDFFTYFFTLILTPMLLLSGVFFPVEQMPAGASNSRRAAAAIACDRHRAAVAGRARARRHPIAPRGAARLRDRRILRRAGADAAPLAEVAPPMLWIKSLHIVFMVTWFAGLFYLPRLFVYHALATDPIGIERFKLMERKLYFGIMTPGAVLTIAFGLWLWLGYGVSGDWLKAKLALVALLIAHHV